MHFMDSYTVLNQGIYSLLKVISVASLGKPCLVWQGWSKSLNGSSADQPAGWPACCFHEFKHVSKGGVGEVGLPGAPRS